MILGIDTTLSMPSEGLRICARAHGDTPSGNLPLNDHMEAHFLLVLYLCSCFCYTLTALFWLSYHAAGCTCYWRGSRRWFRSGCDTCPLAGASGEPCRCSLSVGKRLFFYRSCFGNQVRHGSEYTNIVAKVPVSWVISLFYGVHQQPCSPPFPCILCTAGAMTFSLTGSYEFSEADAACALQAIDSWLDGAAHGAQHISPEKVSLPLCFRRSML